MQVNDPLAGCSIRPCTWHRGWGAAPARTLAGHGGALVGGGLVAGFGSEGAPGFARGRCGCGDEETDADANECAAADVVAEDTAQEGS